MKNNTDANIFIFARYMAFLGSAAVSALLNILFFFNLEPKFAIFFIIASLSLEFCKITTILTANAFGAIHKKFPTPKIKTRQSWWFGWYIVFACLAILASVNFSLTITSRTDQDYLISKNQYEQQIIDLEQKQIRLTEYENSLLSLKQQAELRLQQSQSRIDEIENSFLPWSTTNYPGGWNVYVLARDRRSEELQRWNREQEIYSTSIAKIDNDLTSYKEEVTLLEVSYGKISEIRIKLAELEKNRNANAGASLGFILLANILHLPEQTLKLIILLFISILIEMVVFTTAPDIHITRGFLYYFRNSFPNDISLDKILSTFDKENIKFSDLDKRLEKMENEELAEKKKKNTVIFSNDDIEITKENRGKVEAVKEPIIPVKTIKPILKKEEEIKITPEEILETIEERKEEINEVLNKPNAFNGKKYIIKSAESELSQMLKKSQPLIKEV